MTSKVLIILFHFSTLAFITNAQNYNNIEFIENKGQWDPRVKFKGEVNAGSFFIRQGGFTVLRHHQQDYDDLRSMLHGEDANAAKQNKAILRSHAYNVDFIGASPDVQIIPDKVIPAYNNYFIGNDPAKWASECRIYQAVTLKNVYPNIDIRYYTDNGTLKYDIIARPGADISRIALKYDGIDKLQVKNNELVVGTSVGEFIESFPYTYQANGKERKQINCKYTLKDNIVRFDVKGYDPGATLVIDPPLLIFCSFAGGAAMNWGFTATYGPDGSFYGGCIVFGDRFPVSPGAFQVVFQGGSSDHPQAIDIGIIKLTPNGSNMVYSTYLGGSGNEQPHSIVVNSSGNLIVAGRTNSPVTGAGAYPLTNGGTAMEGPGGGYDIIVTELNATGSGLVGSRRIGGTSDDGVNISINNNTPASLDRNYGDGSRSEVILDGAGNVYVTSSTQSNNFPASPSSFQSSFGGGFQDAVILKFPPDLSSMSFASYLGGDNNDAGYVLAIGPGSDIYVAGGTESSGASFPGNHAGTVGPTNNLNAGNTTVDGFVAQITNNGTGIIRSAFIGTPGIDQVYGIQFDRNGFPYIMGQTTGNWPVSNAAFSNPGSKQFIGKLQPDLSAYIYSTVFGTASPLPNISPTAFLVDRCENVYVSGWGGNTGGYPNSGTNGLPVTTGAIKATTDNNDFYFFVLKKDAVSQLYGSFFGQTGGGGDHVDGGTSRFDENGMIYQSICANCDGATTFPTSPGVWAFTNPSGQCNMAMVKISLNLAGVDSDIASSVNGISNDSTGCVPLTVVFTDEVRNATEYIWNFGDGSGDFGPYQADTGWTRTHTYTNVGTYRVMLIAINPNSCNIRDTSYINIRVVDLIANLALRVTKLQPCESYNYSFENLSSTSPSRPFTNTSFSWRFGDGSSQVAGMAAVTHSYPAPGTYNGWLVLRDDAYCNYPDSIPFTVDVGINVKAGFITDPTGCAPYTAGFDNTSLAGQSYQWNFGDPASGANNTSTAFEPAHVYSVPGTYTITLVANNPGTCNLTDTTRFIITVSEKPAANFSYTPVLPVENQPNFFTNLSSATAIRFKWLFGDGDTLLTTSRAEVRHQYNTSGTFNTCLIAFNNAGCPDTLCMPVTTIITPALDVPNAFTPTSGNINSRIFVRGFSIAKIRFIIWNRWGQKVFETNSLYEGWDGKVKGVLQPMDVYAYTLDAEFVDGTKATRSGDITLIR